MSALEPVLSPVLVGRDDHLAVADRRLAEAAAGRGSALLFAGEAGIGKTRLLGAIRRRAVAQGFREAGGDLAPVYSEIPLAIFGDLARTMTLTPGLQPLGKDLLALAGRAPADPIYTVAPSSSRSST